MSKKPRCRTSLDYALLEERYATFLEIAALPGEERREALLNQFLDQIEAEGRQELPEAQPAGQEEGALENFFTDVTSEREGLGIILPGQPSQPAFPGRSREELGKLVGTFLDLLIADEKDGKPN
jgi:hypothetical protein